jgi:hypothetical protein
MYNAAVRLIEQGLAKGHDRCEAVRIPEGSRIGCDPDHGRKHLRGDGEGFVAANYRR